MRRDIGFLLESTFSAHCVSVLKNGLYYPLWESCMQILVENVNVKNFGPMIVRSGRRDSEIGKLMDKARQLSSWRKMLEGMEGARHD